MPYQVQKQGDQYCVVKIGGETVKCHPNKEAAMNHVRGLYANVHDSAIAQFSMSIVKATAKDGAMKWRSVNSDIEEDFFGERMSLELFADFNQHIQNQDPIPEVFQDAICEEDWCGGMPYMSLAHYKSGAGKVNVPGAIDRVYVDGKALKSTGVLFDSPLGKAVYKSLEKDLTEKSALPVRISIGFLDLEHSHGDKFTFTRKALVEKCPLCKEGIGDKIYKKGHLVHLALTRVPANPRTEMELEQKSMTTKLQDAESIVEDEEVLKGLELKSATENDILVIKAEGVEKDQHAQDCPEGDEECMKKMADKKKAAKKEMSVAENTVVTQSSTVSVEGQASAVAYTEPTPVERSLAALKERVESIKSQNLTGDKALAELQKSFDELGAVVKAEFTPQPTAQDIARQDMEITLRSLLGEMLPQALAQVVAPLQSELGELRALSQAKPPIKKEELPIQRSLSVNLVQKAAIEKLVAKSKSQFDDIARASVGLTQ